MSKLTYEIERKFLLRGPLPGFKAKEAKMIFQGWLPGDQIKERLRCTVPLRETKLASAGRSFTAKMIKDPAAKFYRTIKAGSGIQRIELEDEVQDRKFWSKLWRMTTRRVYKIRWTVAADSLLWEIDYIPSLSIYLLEVELKTKSQKVTVPYWLQPYVVADVTFAKGYTNYNLAWSTI